MPVSWLYQSGWEDYFTVVQWDQRGAGKTLRRQRRGRRRADPITQERMVADGEELVAWLRTHYGKRKIFVLGHSWGSLHAAWRWRAGIPSWLHAYIGMGQMIYGRDNERAAATTGRCTRRAPTTTTRACKHCWRTRRALRPTRARDGSVSIAQILVQRESWLIAPTSAADVRWWRWPA